MATTRGTQRPNWTQVLDGPGAGKPVYQTLTNAVRVIEHDPMWAPAVLWFDEFSGRIMYANSPVREWRDDDDVRLTVHMQDTTGMPRIQKHLVADAVDFVARKRSRHPVCDWLRTLQWDGVDRIALAFEDGWGATSQPADYVQAISRNFFIGLVARVMRPGCKLDTMVVFEGKQGIYKSSALSVIGGQWYGQIDESAASKDFLQVLRGKWLVELAELNAFSKTESTHIKGMLSREIDTYRASYGRRPADIPRQCVFAGTTNHDDWLDDETGGRRFWPIRCGDINLSLIRNQREQWFAEATRLFLAGARWWDVPDSAIEEQHQRQTYDEWTPDVLNWSTSQIIGGGTGWVFVKDILGGALKVSTDKQGKGEQMRVAKILRKNGWRRHPKHKYWVPPQT